MVRWERLCTLGLTLALLSALGFGCAARAADPQRALPDARPSAPLIDAGARAVEPDPSPLDPVLEARLSEADALFDWRNTFFQRPQTVPKRAQTISEKAPFPDPSIAHAKAYAFGFAHTLECGDGVPFAANGTLCPNVVAPGVELSVAQQESVRALLTDAEKNDRPDRHPAVSRCDFDPHHVLVFYDEAGAPIAKLLVCFTCGEWLASPGIHALGGAHQGIMSAAQRHALATLFDDVHLGAWMFDEKIADAASAYEARIYGRPRQYPSEITDAGMKRRARRVSEPSGVPLETEARNATLDERQRLCVWIAETRWQEGLTGQGFDCKNGRRWNFTDRCDAPLRCSAPLGLIERCTRLFIQEPDGVCTMKVGAECAAVLDCLPGIAVAPSPQWTQP